jgi:hypothetical protein
MLDEGNDALTDQVPLVYCAVAGPVTNDNLWNALHGSERMAETVKRRGLARRGERNGSARLTEAKVREIRKQLKAQVPKPEIAKRLGVAPKTIRSITSGHRWGWFDSSRKKAPKTKRRVRTLPKGALGLTQPLHLLIKLEYELEAFRADQQNSYAAINALRDAYHLREWIWHGRLESDEEFQAAIMGAAGNEDEWNHWVNKEFPDFKIIRELCNGSKHFEADDAVSRTIEPKYLMAYNKGLLGYNTRGIFVQLAAGRMILSCAATIGGWTCSSNFPS